MISVASAVAERCGDRNNDAAMRQPGNDDTLRPDTSPRDRRHRKDPAVRARPALYLQLPADPIAPSVARHRIRRWLTGSCWPPGQQEDIVLAVSEAVSNAIKSEASNRWMRISPAAL